MDLNHVLRFGFLSSGLLLELALHHIDVLLMDVLVLYDIYIINFPNVFLFIFLSQLLKFYYTIKIGLNLYLFE